MNWLLAMGVGIFAGVGIGALAVYIVMGTRRDR